MIQGIVKFWDLGREDAKGEFKIEAQTTDEFNEKMLKEFSEHLFSSNISFDDGKIYAGFRNVGNFQFIAVEEKLAGVSEK